MLENGKRISLLQAFMIMLLMNGLASHVIVNPMLLDASGRDAWIAVLFTGAFYIPWCALLAFVMRRTGQRHLHLWIADRTHPILSWCLTAPIVLLFYMIGGMTVVHTTTWTITNYLPETPKWVLILALTLICMIFALWGLQVLAITSGILLPFVILLGIFVSLSNIPQKNYHLLMPMLEHGLQPVLNGMIYAGGGLVEIVALLFMQHRISTRVKPWHLLLFGLVSLYIMLGPVLGAIMEFGPREAAKQMESPYEQWRLVKLGPYVEHVDFFSIYQWLSGATVRVAVSLFLIAEMLPIKRPAVRSWTIIGVTASYIAAATLPINEYTFYMWMYRYYFPASLAIFIAVSLLGFAVSLASRLRRREESA